MLISLRQIIFMCKSLLYTAEVKSAFIEKNSIRLTIQHNTLPFLHLMHYSFVLISQCPEFSVLVVYSTITRCMDLPLNECHINVQALLIHC